MSPNNQTFTGQGATILFAEDDELIRRMFLEALEAAGYTVLAAADGREAYERFREHPDDIDLVVADVIMPNMDGKELARRCRDQRPEIRVLFTSANAYGRIDPKEDINFHADFIPKPFSPRQLLQKVTDLLERNEKA